MKGYHFAVLAMSAMVAEETQAFTPSPFAVDSNLASRSTANQSRGSSQLCLSTSNPPGSSPIGSEDRNCDDEEIAFPYDEEAIRFAYDGWRSIYGKGESDATRYEQFKQNYMALTVANLKAKKQAETSGVQAPDWQTLNEFGDFSLEEFEAYKRGDLVVSASGTQARQESSQPATRSQGNVSTLKRVDGLRIISDRKHCLN